MALLENLDWEEDGEDERPAPAGVLNPPLMAQWSKFRAGFAAEMEPGFWTIEDLEAKVRRGQAFFFPGKDAALVGEIVVYPGGEQVFHLKWATGGVAEIVALEPGVAAIARMMGCSSILIESRLAWKKLLAPLGYELCSVKLRRGL